MRNYIHADLKRILRRTPHALSMLLLFVIYGLCLYVPNAPLQVTSVSLITSACGILSVLLAFVGLFEMIGVFSEDFKVKTMQVAIGLGVSRSKVVICKLLEVFMLLVADAIVITAITLGVGMVLDVSVPLAVLNDLIKVLLVQGILGPTIHTAITMMVLFTVQSTVLAIFVYMLVSFDIFAVILQLLPLVGMHWLEDLRLNRFTLNYLLNAFDARLALGTFDFLSFLGMMIYLAVGVFFTCKLFKKRELDF